MIANLLYYFDVNEDAIFDICQNKIPPLAATINKMIKEISTGK